MSWYKVDLTCNKNDATIIEEILVAHNAISISITQEKGNNDIYEPKVGETPLWNTIKLSALFDKKISKEVILGFIKGVSHSNLYINKLDDQNWIEKYQTNFKPIRFGKKLWVVPSWSRMPLNQEGIELKMDPGMAFGSGSHETTHLCLEYLERAKLNNLTILDYGCGSGILSIASLALGAKYAIATDVDPQALESTKNNSINNNVAEKIEIVLPDLIPKTKIDILVANIFFNTLIDLRDEFLQLLNSGSKIVISGIMFSQLVLIHRHYEKFFNFKNVKIKNNWCLLEYEKK